MLLHGTNGRFVRIRFRGGESGSALVSDSPVIKHARNVADLRHFDLLDAPQGKVVILRTLKTEAESTDRAHKLPSVNAQMGNVILRSEEVRIPIRLEIGIAAAA